MNLDDELRRLSDAATPGPWGGDKPERIYVHGQPGPIMSYLYGGPASVDGMKVSIASERLADHEFVAVLVNAWRGGKLEVKL